MSVTTSFRHMPDPLLTSSARGSLPADVPEARRGSLAPHYFLRMAQEDVGPL
jgi:hypothetical protein